VKINAGNINGTTFSVIGLSASTLYNFYVVAKDAAGNVSPASNVLSVSTTVPSICSGTGAIAFQKWNNINGLTVASLTSVPAYPNSPSVTGTLTSFEIPTNADDHYGIRVNGYICPPVTGAYTFWIAGDDYVELWLSTTSSAADKVKIAYHNSWTSPREWNRFATQKSAIITLNAGQLYYVEALMKEETGGDNLAVGWAKPGESFSVPSEVIPGTQLVAQVTDLQPPAAPTGLAASAITPSSLNLTWNPAVDNVGVTGYDLFQNNVKINAGNINGTTFSVTGLAASTAYNFYATARDAAGNVSNASNIVNISTTAASSNTEIFTMRTIIANQRMPHDLVYGPDNNIWFIERSAGTVSFINPVTSIKKQVLSLGTKMVYTGGQDGLIGLALHPKFNSGYPYIFIAYTYEVVSPAVLKTRIERYTYNSFTQTLETPVTIIQDIPGSNDHNSGRLAVGPDLKIYYTVGDMGAGQFNNINRPNNAQNVDVLEGKVLRLNTELINNSWIPADNPFSNAGNKTPVYSLGHRNAQGLVWGKVNGVDILYSSEHGPYSDDEINIIQAGRNYGWPRVVGYCDGNYNGRTVGGYNIVSEQNNCVALNVKEPIRSLFPAAVPPTDSTSNSTWPTTAPSGTDFYGSTGIPGWQNSLLIAQLKTGAITRLKLSDDGLSIVSDTMHYFRGKGRFRDVAMSSDGLRIYVACDSSGATSGPTGDVVTTPPNPGSILEFTFQPTVLSRVQHPSINNNQTDLNKNRKYISIYPNPANGLLNVNCYNLLLPAVIELYDIAGKLIKKQVVIAAVTNIETSTITSGFYLLEMKDKNGKIVSIKKLLISH